MRHLPAVAIVAITFLAAAANPAFAQSDDDILAAMAQWSDAYSNAIDADQMLALYHPDAVFWGTGSRVPMAGAAAFAPYFQRQFDNYTDRGHGFVDPVIRFYANGEVATSTGLYRFNVTPIGGGAPVEVLYRFSFSYVLTDQGWLIIQQHSSELP